MTAFVLSFLCLLGSAIFAALARRDLVAVRTLVRDKVEEREPSLGQTVPASVVMITLVGLSGLAVCFYVAKFAGVPLSGKPEKWGVFGDYLGGVLNPLLAAAALYVTWSIAKVAHAFESRRAKEQAKPVAQIFVYDYLNSLKVVVRNIGVGPLVVSDFYVRRGDDESSQCKDLRMLVPDPDHGILWRNYTIDGIPDYIHEQSEIVLLHLEGDLRSPVFRDFRNRVRQSLEGITVRIEYHDIYGGNKGSKQRRLVIPSNHSLKYAGEPRTPLDELKSFEIVRGQMERLRRVDHGNPNLKDVRININALGFIATWCEEDLIDAEFVGRFFSQAYRSVYDDIERISTEIEIDRVLGSGRDHLESRPAIRELYQRWSTGMEGLSYERP